MISDRYSLFSAGMPFAGSEAVRNIGFPLPWVGVRLSGGGIFYGGIGYGSGLNAGVENEGRVS